MWDLIRSCIPNDHSRQVDSRYYVNQLTADKSRHLSVLDVGCGTGASHKLFTRGAAQVDWFGVDIIDSPEVHARTQSEARLVSYDGRHLPFADSSFDAVYSNQVFEHVRHPETLLGEIHRVLRPGGSFIGSVSYLEPYHSFSFWNFTPYGWFVILSEAGLTPIEFRPGIDSIALIRRQYLGRPAEASDWFKKSPLNSEIQEWGQQTRRKPAQINLRKLQYCGHLVFRADRTGEVHGEGCI